MLKLSFRDIRTTLGKFLAIAAIIALGVGLFAGLRVSRTAMVNTGDQYLQDLLFYDYRLLSTLGFTDEDVAAFRGLPFVAAAEGSLTQDALYTAADGSDQVASFLSLTTQVNRADLTAGRMPQTAGECLADADAFTEADLGTTLTLSDANDQDTLDAFSGRQFTIVGLAVSPLYLNYERGSTSLGNGTVSCFVYLPREAFSADYYTELYVRLGRTAPLYSEAYDALTDQYEPQMESLLNLRADLRYQTLYNDARTELDDGWAELEDARAAYTEGRLEAEEALWDGREELDDARDELDDGWAAWQEGWDTLLAETDAAQQLLEENRRQLEDALSELEDGEAQYADGAARLEDGEQQYQEGLAAYLDAVAAYEDGKALYEESLAAYEDGVAQYQAGLASYQAGLTQYESGRSQYQSGLQQYQLGAARLEQQLAAAGTTIEALRALVAENQAAVALLRRTLEPLAETLAAQLPPSLGIADGTALLEVLANEADPAYPLLASILDPVLAALGNPLLPDTAALHQAALLLAQYDQAEAALDAWAQLEDSRQVLEATAARLETSEAQLTAAKEQLDDTEAQLNEAQALLADSAREMEAGRVQLEAAQAELEASRRELDDGWAETEAARQQLDDSWQQYQDGTAALAAGQAQLDAEAAAGRAQLEDSRQELEDGEWAYTDGVREYQSGRQEAQDQLAEASDEIRDGQAELEDGEAELADLAYPEVYLLGREANVGYVCFENDTNIVSSVARVFPLFFFLVAALVCITTMTRMVEDERTKIGVLKALGYSNGAIMGKYLLYAASASLLGCLVGYLAGSWLFPRVFWVVYGIMYSFHCPIEFVLDIGLAFSSIGLYLLCALGSTWMVCRTSLKEVAAELIRPKAPKVGKRILLERIPLLWRHLSFLHKVSVRNIFRYKKRLFMMVLGIGGCTALLLTGFGIRDSISNIVDYQFDEISLYDSQVTFQDAMSTQDQAAFLRDCTPSVERAVFFHGATVDVSAGDTTTSVNLVVAGDDMAQVWDFHRGDSPVAYPGDGEAMITVGLAERLQVSVGDTLTVRDGDNRVMTVTVSGIFDNYVYHYLFLTPETAREQLGEALDVQSAYVVSPSGADPHQAAAQLLDYEGVAAVSVNADMRDRMGSTLSSLDYVVVLIILCAGSLAFIVLYNLTNINITERIREIATIKVLGFYPGETAAYVFRENVVLTGLGALAGIALGRLLHAYVMAQIRIDMMHFEVRVAPLSYLFSFALTFVFAAVVNAVMYRKLQKIPMAESLKSIE